MKYRISLIIVLLLVITGCKWTLGTDPVSSTYSIQTISRQSFGADAHLLNIKNHTAFILDSQNGLIEISIGDPHFTSAANDSLGFAYFCKGEYQKAKTLEQQGDTQEKLDHLFYALDLFKKCCSVFQNINATTNIPQIQLCPSGLQKGTVDQRGLRPWSSPIRGEFVAPWACFV